jgi:hypothetical protein
MKPYRQKLHEHVIAIFACALYIVGLMAYLFISYQPKISPATQALIAQSQATIDDAKLANADYEAAKQRGFRR